MIKIFKHFYKQIFLNNIIKKITNYNMYKRIHLKY
jgi:hypothetical protein